MKEIEIKATTVEGAVSEGLIELGVSRDMVEIEILSKPSVFKKAHVKLTVTCADATVTEPSEIAVNAQTETESSSVINDSFVADTQKTVDSYDETDKPIVEFVTNLLDKMNLDCSLKITSTEDKLVLLIVGKDTNYSIGYRGEALDAIQYITLLVANKPERFAKRLIIDAEGYRERRADTLTALSKKLASQAVKSGKAIELEPMNPFERRVIHTALQENPAVTTISEGEEPNRFVVICPVKDAPSYDNANKSNFKKSGFGKTRSFGQKKRKF